MRLRWRCDRTPVAVHGEGAVPPPRAPPPWMADPPEAPASLFTPFDFHRWNTSNRLPVALAGGTPVRHVTDATPSVDAVARDEGRVVADVLTRVAYDDEEQVLEALQDYKMAARHDREEVVFQQLLRAIAASRQPYVPFFEIERRLDTPWSVKPLFIDGEIQLVDPYLAQLTASLVHESLREHMEDVDMLTVRLPGLHPGQFRGLAAEYAERCIAKLTARLGALAVAPDATPAHVRTLLAELTTECLGPAIELLRPELEAYLLSLRRLVETVSHPHNFLGLMQEYEKDHMRLLFAIPLAGFHDALRARGCDPHQLQLLRRGRPAASVRETMLRRWMFQNPAGILEACAQAIDVLQRQLRAPPASPLWANLELVPASAGRPSAPGGSAPWPAPLHLGHTAGHLLVATDTATAVRVARVLAVVHSALERGLLPLRTLGHASALSLAARLCDDKAALQSVDGNTLKTAALRRGARRAARTLPMVRDGPAPVATRTPRAIKAVADVTPSLQAPYAVLLSIRATLQAHAPGATTEVRLLYSMVSAHLRRVNDEFADVSDTSLRQTLGAVVRRLLSPRDRTQEWALPPPGVAYTRWAPGAPLTLTVPKADAAALETLLTQWLLVMGDDAARAQALWHASSQALAVAKHRQRKRAGDAKRQRREG